jgi:hypothetical protein
MPTSPSPETVRDILASLEADSVARYQDPKIEIRKDVKRPYYQIRPYVPVITENGVVKRRVPIKLGFVDETKKSEVKARKEEKMAPINAVITWFSASCHSRPLLTSTSVWHFRN